MFLVYIINNITQVSFRDLYFEMVLKLRHDFCFQDVEWRNIWVLLKKIAGLLRRLLALPEASRW
jgi:hypothetical protein